MKGENLWPTETMPGFEEVLSDYYRRLRSFGRTLARNFALGLDLPEDFFAKYITHPGCSAVIAHYPPQEPTSSSLGIDSHTDSECTSEMTLAAFCLVTDKCFQSSRY
jgi:isopenicillin N synthase-like dioxygenase